MHTYCSWQYSEQYAATRHPLHSNSCLWLSVLYKGHLYQPQPILPLLDFRFRTDCMSTNLASSSLKDLRNSSQIIPASFFQRIFLGKSRIHPLICNQDSSTCFRTCGGATTLPYRLPLTYSQQATGCSVFGELVLMQSAKRPTRLAVIFFSTTEERLGHEGHHLRIRDEPDDGRLVMWSLAIFV